MRTSPNVLYKVLKLYEAVMNALGYKLIEDVTGDLIPIPTSNLKLR